MTYFVNSGSSNTDIVSAVNYILANLNTNYLSNSNTGIITTSTTATSATSTTGQTTRYLYRYLDVAFADNYAGNQNFSSTPLSTSKFFGLRNTNTNAWDSNPTDYVWYQVAGGFPTGTFLWYQTFGGLQINLVVSAFAPSPAYQICPNAVPIDLTIISTATNLLARTAYTISYDTLANTPASYTTTGNSTFPPPGTWDTTNPETWVANPPSYNAAQNLWEIDGIYNPSTNLTTWAAPYLATLKVGELSAITINAGQLTVNSPSTGSGYVKAGTVNYSGGVMSGYGGILKQDGTFAFGNASAGRFTYDGTNFNISGSNFQVGSAVQSGTSMTGTGATFNPSGASGTFALGNSSTNISFNGSTLYLNGSVVATNSIQGNAVTVTAGYSISSTTTFGAYSTILSVSINSSGAPIWINVNINSIINVTGGGSIASVFILKNGSGTPIDTYNSGNIADGYPLTGFLSAYLSSSPSTTTTYTVEFLPNDGSSNIDLQTYSNIFAIATKR